MCAQPETALKTMPSALAIIADPDVNSFNHALLWGERKGKPVQHVRRHIRRTHPEFWATSDTLNAEFLRQQPVEAGLLDLNRYKDPKSDDDPS